MSGHSKWSTIKRQKGVADIKRGQIFTKLSNAIIIAVREGGGIGDPQTNFKLRLAIDKARSANMPKENIQRAIEKGRGKGEGASLEHVVYEGFAPGGVAFIVEATTDSRLRTTSEVRNLIEKNGGTIATPGAVSYQFEQKGLVTAAKDGKTLEDIFLIAADGGAQDVEEVGDEVLIYTKPEELAKVRDNLQALGIKIIDAELTRKPISEVRIEDKEVANRLLSFMEKLEALDDVQKVYANFDIADELIG